MSPTPYLTVKPRPDIQPVSRIDWTPDLLDYEGHAAYGDLIRNASMRARLEALSIFALSMVKLLSKRLIRYEFIPHDVRIDTSLGGRARFLFAALKNIFTGPVREGITTLGLAGAGRMTEDGIHVVTMPPDWFAVLEAAAGTEFDRLALRRGESRGQRQFEESRAQANRTEQSNLFDVIETILTDAGVFSVASAYLGRESVLVDVNPQINDTSDTFWRDIFPDASLSSLPPTAYCHRDASGGDLKAIIYMTDVGDRTGPFSYVIGSNRMRISRLDDLICKANDSNGLCGTDLVSRARFAALPRKFRQKGAFGNDLTPDSVLGREIGASLWPVTAGKGSIILFDTKGIHRGGMVEDGERRVITCVIG